MTSDELPGWLRWTAVVVVAAGLLYASLLDSPGTGLAPLGPLGVFGLDKWLHAVGYAALAGTLAVALSSSRSLATAAALAVLIAVAYGIGLEFAQAPLPERHFSVADMAADAVGAVVAVLCWRLGVEYYEKNIMRC